MLTAVFTYFIINIMTVMCRVTDINGISNESEMEGIDCATVIISNPETFSQTVDFSIRPTPVIMLNIDISTNESSVSEPGVADFFKKEWTPEDLSITVVTGASKHSRNCALAVIKEFKCNIEPVLSHILRRHLARPHFDYWDIFVDEKCPTSTQKPMWLHKLNLIGSTPTNLPYKSSLEGRHYKIAVTDAPHFIGFNNDPVTGQLASARGVVYEMLAAASTWGNFTFDLRYSTGRGTGSKVNGSWKGTAGDVFNGIADFGINLGISLSRQRVIDATTAYEYTRLTFIGRQPQPETRWVALVKSYETCVWALVFVTAVAYSLMILLAMKLEMKEKPAFPLVHLGDNSDVSDSIILVLGMLMDQSMKHELLRNKSRLLLRLIFVPWLIGALIIGTGYKSRLVGFLTFPFREDPLETFEQLADQKDYTVNFLFFGGVAYNSFKTSSIPAQRALFPRFVIQNSSPKCIQSVLMKERTVCILFNEAMAYAIASNYTLYPGRGEALGDFYAAKEFAILVPLVWAFPKGSLLTPIFNEFIGRVMSAGFHDYWVMEDRRALEKKSAEWLHRAKDSNDIISALFDKLHDNFQNRGKSCQPLTFKNLVGALGILGGGMLLGVIIIGFEVVRIGRGRRQGIVKLR